MAPQSIRFSITFEIVLNLRRVNYYRRELNAGLFPLLQKKLHID